MFRTRAYQKIQTGHCVVLKCSCGLETAAAGCELAEIAVLKWCSPRHGLAVSQCSGGLPIGKFRVLLAKRGPLPLLPWKLGSQETDVTSHSCLDWPLYNEESATTASISS